MATPSDKETASRNQKGNDFVMCHCFVFQKTNHITFIDRTSWNQTSKMMGVLLGWGCAAQTLNTVACFRPKYIAFIAYFRPEQKINTPFEF